LFRLSILPELFWGILNAISYFFTTLFSEVESDVYAKKGKRTKPVRGFGGNGGPGGPPGGDQRHRGPNLRGMGDLRDRDKKVPCMPGGG